MGIVILEIPTKRPDWATPAKCLAMLRAGIRPGEIAQAIGVSPSRVTRLIAKARREENSAKLGA